MTNRILPVVYQDRESETRTPAQPLIVIPSEARDPFSAMPPDSFVNPWEADLTRISPGRPVASGQPITVTGQVLDEDGRPVQRSLIEIWNANANGRYSHSGDSASSVPLDPNFYGFGRLFTDDDGVYRLRTIRPGAYLARFDIGWWRPPHVHFSILGGGIRLVTQMYFPGEELNQKDYIHMTIPEDERIRVIATAAQPNVYRFDITVRGRYQNAFAS